MLKACAAIAVIFHFFLLFNRAIYDEDVSDT